MTNYKGLNIPEKVWIIEKPYVEHNNTGASVAQTKDSQGYFVPFGNNKMLKTALAWAKCEEEYNKETDQLEFVNKEKYIHTYKNGAFKVKLKESAWYSSQGGALSFWNCTITVEDGKSFDIGINSELLLQLLLHNSFINGVCSANVYLGRLGGNATGLFTENMPDFAQAKADERLRETKTTDKYVKGQIVYTKRDLQLYIGALYQKVLIYPVKVDNWSGKTIYYITIPKKPALQYMYISTDEKYINNNNVNDLLKYVSGEYGYLEEKNTKVKRFVKTDFSAVELDTYDLYYKNKKAGYQYIIDKNNITERDLAHYKAAIDFAKIEYSTDDSPLKLTAENKDIIYNWIKYRLAFSPSDLKEGKDYVYVTEKEYTELKK